MKGLLIFLAIFLIQTIAQKIRESKLKKEEEARRQAAPPPSGHAEDSDANRNLQDLIRQFENAQQQAAQGNIEPALPTNFNDNEDDELPVVEPSNQGSFTFREIAESVIQWEYVSVELLQQAFQFSPSTARQVLQDLQQKKICSASIDDDECDLLVHSKVELENLLARQQREAESQKAHSELQKRREMELEHQRTLAELEKRAQEIREQNSLSGELPEAETEIPIRRRTIHKSEIRRGFIWAKILDEPRFKRKWNSQVR